MQDIKDIKKRIKSVQETAQITKAMELISVSKMHKIDGKYQKNINYYEQLREVIKNIIKYSGKADHPYLQERPGKRTVFLVVAGDTGLAGDYNHKILNYAVKRVAEAKQKRIYTIGQMSYRFFVEQGIKPDAQFLYCAQNPSLEDARRITAYMLDLFDDDKTDEVNVIFTASRGNTGVPQTLRLLPLNKSYFFEEDTKHYIEPMRFEPSPKEVFDILVPQYVIGIMYNALLQAVRCEHLERMLTMNTATNNADKMLSELELDYNRTRQGRITTEIIEIVSGKREG